MGPGAGCRVPGARFGSGVPGSVQVPGSRYDAQRTTTGRGQEPGTSNPRTEPSNRTLNPAPGTRNPCFIRIGSMAWVILVRTLFVLAVTYAAFVTHPFSTILIVN